MINNPEKKLKSLIKCKINNENHEFRKWFLKQFETDDENLCSLEEFAVYFLNTLRQHTEAHVIKTNGVETPKCQTPVKSVEGNNNREEVDSLPGKISQKHASVPKNNPNLNNFCTDIDTPSTPRLSSSLDRLVASHSNTTCTPINRNVIKNSQRPSSSSGSANKSLRTSLCLGDFLFSNTPTSSRSHKKKTTTPTANQQSSQKSQNDKPKKRLQPITISKNVEQNRNNSSIFAGESSFSNENNILKISNTELDDKNQCAVLAARKSLAFNASEITKEIENVPLPASTVTNTNATCMPIKENATFNTILLDLKELRSNISLRTLAQIYTLIVDLNLTTSILNELSFLLNLLNAPQSNNEVLNKTNDELSHLHLDDNESDVEGLSMLENLTNAIYFAILCLEHEKNALASLDAKSLGVVLIGERFSYLPDDVKTYLLDIYQRKQQLIADKPFSDTSLCFDSKACSNVYFHHEQDSKENFTSHLEFTNFRAQRDLFYKCLKIWESYHLNPSWKFSTEITPKIKEIFYISENCINMAHLAKLFVSQLILSASNASSPEEIGLDVDQQKLSKLTQRLIAPSQFSVDYQFPRTEAFFRDFILESCSLAFAEQLKMELCAQLAAQNDSSLDHINITKNENDADEQNVSLNECSPSDHVIVRPDILNSMLIIAKFLGFSIALPYNINSYSTIPSKVEKNQVKLRSLMQPSFDICALLEQAIEQNKLLIAIPWLVQYFAILDNITLQLENSVKAIKLLFALYFYLGLESSKSFCTSSLFLMKMCLGWLFESKQTIAEHYYSYRAMLNDKSSELNFVKSKLKCNTFDCNLSETIVLNPYLESLLPIACPFLAEFRVSIMPAKYAQTKNASRTGRYRHITTRIAELPSSPSTKVDVCQNKDEDVQKSLIQAFLHSQNSSTRQIIKLCTERCYKSTVKDGQLKIVLPAKTNADNLVNEITSFEYQLVYKKIKTFYGEAYAKAKAEWEECIPKILHTRINNALDGLLPEETAPALKKTYFMIIEKEAAIKISDWFYGYIEKDNYFCPDLNEMAEKICNANQNNSQLGSNQLTIINETPSVSDLIDDLQYWLHCTSVRVERFTDPKPIVSLLTNLIISFENVLPTFLYHLLGNGVVKLMQNIITKHYSHLIDELIEAACEVWLHPNMQNATDCYSSSGICIYDSLFSTLFIESLDTRRECFNQLGHLIIIMIKKQILTVNYINELFVAILKYEWHPLVLKEISNMLRTIAKATSDVPQEPLCKNNDNGKKRDYSDDDDTDKSILYMNMLADLPKDVDLI